MGNSGSVPSNSSPSSAASDLSFLESKLLIAGELRPATSGASYADINPATAEPFAEAADGSIDDLDQAIASCSDAFENTDWATDPAFRAHCLRQLHSLCVEYRELWRQLTVAEVGAPLALTYGAQLNDPIEGLAWVADLVDRYDWEQSLGVAKPFGIATDRIARREPAGVVGAITPWNFPNQINIAKVAPALGAGCTVVLKPAPDTPLTGVFLGWLAAQTDMPPGVLNVVTGSDPALGAPLSTDERVAMVSFTGSTATGRIVMEAASASVKPVFLELGGKSAFVVLDDADLASAAGLAGLTVCTHAGQGCAITTRILLPRDRYEEGVELVAATMTAMGPGDPNDPSIMFGPVISERQRQRVLSYVDLGKDEGARLVIGGGTPPDLPGFYVQPTLFADVTNDMRVAREEIFGPVMVAIPYDTDDEAVAIANDSPYGLSGSVFSADTEHAMAVARRIRTGTVSVNGGIWYGHDVPFGGYKQSGIGREMGVAGFEEYLQTKVIAVAV